MKDLEEIRNKMLSKQTQSKTTTDRYQIAKGEYKLPYLHLVYVKDFDKYYILQTSKKSIGGIVFKDVKYKYLEDTVYHQVDKTLYDVMVDAITERKKRVHLDNYSFMVGYCLARGYDLDKLGIF